MKFFDDYGKNGIDKMENVVKNIKDFLNKNVSAMDVIDEPETAIFCKEGFDMIDGFIQSQKDMNEKMDKIITLLEDKTEDNKNVTREIERIRKEMENMKKKHEES